MSPPTLTASLPPTAAPGCPLPWSMDPLDAFARFPKNQPVMFLHSGRYHPRWSRYSLLAQPRGAYVFSPQPNGHAHGQWLGGNLDFTASFSDQPFHDLRLLLAQAPGPWVGYLSYDLGRWIERLPQQAADDRSWPLIYLAYCPDYLLHDRQSNTWTAHGRFAHAQDRPDLPHLPPLRAAFASANPQSVFTRPAYENTIQWALDYISAGDIFQVNLAQRFSADFQGDFPLAHRSLYAALAAASPAWYGAYMELLADPNAPEPQRVIASTSPELFLELSPAGQVTSRPIKGTLPASAAADLLKNSEKDAAELHMIVDLVRNDLGRVCAYGSVQVQQARAIESHPTIHHGVATITGRLHSSKDAVDLLRAAFPPGSVTGAPKVRALQIIDELEPVRRGPYCGALGWITADSLCLNVAIRTMLFESHGPRGAKVDYSVGGGIVADSIPANEYQETLHKAQAILQALGIAPGKSETSR
ncbi:MAG: anthranilate synthase component I family protein [Phycisphaeraceae bacterium]|nr:anthranilate synthase component I family protein [Phycisphaeraceae bacterium]